MNRNRIDIVLAPLLIGVILVATWLFGTEPLAHAEASIEAQRVAAQGANLAHTAKVDGLREQNNSIDVLREQLADLRTVFPPQQNLTVFISTVGSIARASGVSVASIVPEIPVPYVPSAQASTGAGAAASSAPLGTASVFTVRVSIAVAGSKAAVGAFTDGMQHSKRLFVVNGITSTLVAGDSVTSTVSGYIFVAQPKAAGN